MPLPARRAAGARIVPGVARHTQTAIQIELQVEIDRFLLVSWIARLSDGHRLIGAGWIEMFVIFRRLEEHYTSTTDKMNDRNTGISGQRRE
jgi:hypothetical protein